MRILSNILLRNCLLSSIAHAIMTNLYPELSYEQSWDGCNYSFQDEQVRGTFTFYKGYCVGAIRSGLFKATKNETEINKLLKEFPDNIIDIACSETLQYLLIEQEGQKLPSVNSIFWCNNQQFVLSEHSQGCMEYYFKSLPIFIDTFELLVQVWKEYYDMDANALNLLFELFEMRKNDYEGKIFLSQEQKKMISCERINEDCKQALQELGIYFE